MGAGWTVLYCTTRTATRVSILQVGERVKVDTAILGRYLHFGAVEVDRALIQPNVEDGEEKYATYKPSPGGHPLIVHVSG